MIQFDATIMGQIYKLTCKADEKASLQKAVSYLNEKMCAIQDTGKIKGNDRIAVMAALGIAAELLLTKSPDEPLTSLSLSELSEIKQKMAAMQSILDSALTPQKDLF